MIHNYDELNENIPKNDMKNKDKSPKIEYEILGNDSNKTLDILPEKRNKKNNIEASIPENFNIKMILGSPQKVRATASRIIKMGAKGKIPQTLVNSLIWQLRSLVYFDQVCADLSYMARIEALERQLKKAEK